MSSPSGAEYMTTEELFRQHAGFVTRFLACCGVPEKYVEDAVQEVFLVVHRNGGYRPGIAKPTSYLGGIAIHAARKHRRRELVDRRRRSDHVVEHMASETPNPARSAQVQQDLRRLQLALDRLPDELRTTLLLVELEGESCVSVAAAFGCPVGTVYWRLHQARKKLQSALKWIDAERTQPRRAPAPAAGLEKRPLPNLGMVMLFGGESSFDKSEAGRLLRLAREQLGSPVAPDQLLARHQQLVQSGAELPSWAASCVPHTTSCAALIGVGPIGASLAVGGAVLAAVMLLPNPTSPKPSAAPVQNAPRPSATRSAEALQAAAVTQTAQVESHRRPPEPRGKGPDEKRAAQVDPGASSASPSRGNAKRVRTIYPSRASLPSANPVRESVSGLSRAAALRSGALRGSVSGPTAESRTETHPLLPTEAVAPSPPRPAPEDQRASQDASTRTSQPDAGPSAAPNGGTAAAPYDPFVVEIRALADAERLLSTEPARALAIARRLRANSPVGYFREERAYVEVMALLELGRIREGRGKAAEFLRSYPDGPYSRRVRNAAANADAER